MTSNLEFNIENFVGPMDLLLHLVKETKMDIYEVNISEIVDQFLAYINQLQSKNIDLSSEFLLVASELLHLKSRKLINKLEIVEEEDEFSIASENDLLEKIVEYDKYKQMINELKILEEKRAEIYTKIPENLAQYEQSQLNKEKLDADLLMKALLEWQERLHFNEPLNTKIAKKELSILKRTEKIRSILKEKKMVEFIELFEVVSREYIVITLLAILQLSKNKEIEIKQENNFDYIWIEGKEHE